MEQLDNFLTCKQASQLANSLGYQMSDRTVRWALLRGYLAGRKINHDWLIHKDTFLNYLQARPKPGPKPR